jgi:hypothetical protein
MPFEAFRETETHHMKHHVRTLACGAALLAAMALTGCSAQHLAVAEEPAMDHTTMDHAALDQSTMDDAAMDHSNMPGMEHEASTAAAHDMAGMQHDSASVAPGDVAPTSNAAIAATQPAGTLRADEFDAPAPAAVEEVAKASGATPPAAEHHHHGNGGAS